MKNKFLSFKLWRILFLFFLVVITLFIVFQNQISDSYSEYKDLKIFTEKKTYSAKSQLDKIDIKFTDACDMALKKFAALDIHHTHSCTEIACKPEAPCCNSCLIHWYSETEELKINFNFEHPILKPCQIDGCGKIYNCDIKSLKVQDLLTYCK